MSWMLAAVSSSHLVLHVTDSPLRRDSPGVRREIKLGLQTCYRGDPEELLPVMKFDVGLTIFPPAERRSPQGSG